MLHRHSYWKLLFNFPLLQIFCFLLNVSAYWEEKTCIGGCFFRASCCLPPPAGKNQAFLFSATTKLNIWDIQIFRNVCFHVDIINTDNRCLSINITCKLNIMHQPTGKLSKQGILFLLKSLWNVLQYHFCFMFFFSWPHGILSPQPGTEPTPPSLEGKISNSGPPGVFEGVLLNVVWIGSNFISGKKLACIDVSNPVILPIRWKVKGGIILLNVNKYLHFPSGSVSFLSAIFKKLQGVLVLHSSMFQHVPLCHGTCINSKSSTMYLVDQKPLQLGCINSYFGTL